MGAIHELVVAVDLMKRGYHVFRSLSPSCPCDLAVVKDHALIRIEVRTGYRKLNGELYFPKQGTEPDHYAVVHSGGSVEYVPPLLTAQR